MGKENKELSLKDLVNAQHYAIMEMLKAFGMADPKAGLKLANAIRQHAVHPAMTSKEEKKFTEFYASVAEMHAANVPGLCLNHLTPEVGPKKRTPKPETANTPKED